MFDMIFQFFFQKNIATDLILLICLTVSGLFSALIPRTKDKMLGVIYGNKNDLRVRIKDLFSLLWFFSSILFLVRAVIVGIGIVIDSFSIWKCLLVLCLYVIIVFIDISIVLFLNSMVENKWYRLHKKEANRILNDNPIYKKCIDECNNNTYKAIFILADKIVISNEQVITEYINYQTEETQYIPVSSDGEALDEAKMIAQNWKNKISSLLSTKGLCIHFSAYGYGLISDKSMTQLSEGLAEHLALKSYEIKKRFCVRHTTPISTYLSGQGETLRATTSVGKTYDADVYAMAAIILYKPLSQPIQMPEKHLTQW